MRNFILGTDWGEDCDDAVAVRLLCRAHLAGEINLLGVGINTRTEYSAPSLYAFMENEGCIRPIGVDKNCPKSDWQNRYQPRLAKRTDKRDEDFEDAVRLYRRLICEAEGKVEILEIGFLQVLAGAIASGPDDISTKTGLELFSEKVSRIWCMGGKWTADGEKEFNLSYTPFACKAANYVCDNCPSPITFLGWEIGANLLTGDTLDKDDILHQALVDWGTENGRESWDPMLCLLALIGDCERAGYDTVSGTAWLNPENGTNYFKRGEGKHEFVIKKFPDSYYKDAVNSRIE